MNAQIELNRFKTVFCNTLKRDDQGRFIKIRIDNYQELNFFRHNIIDAIELIATLQTNTEQGSELGFTIKALTNILKSINMFEESQGIDELFIEPC